MTDLAKRIEALSPEKRALLLQQLEQNRGPHGPTSIPRLASETTVFPLSLAQQRLWLLEQLDPGTPAYNLAGVIRLTGRLNVAALERSLNTIVRRHAALRTTFTGGETPKQVVAPELSVALPITDLRPFDPDGREAEALRLAGVAAWQPFDLARGPLLRVQLLQLDDEVHWLLLTIHHIVSDGWSVEVFVGELAALYPALRANRPVPLPELSIQYTDFSAWQQQRLYAEGGLDRQLAYWKNQLAGAPALLELPADRPRPAVKTFRGANHVAVLSPTLAAALKVLAAQTGATLFMTLLAAFQTLLYRYTGQADVVVGSPVANRTHQQVEWLIGFFVNTLVLRAGFSGNPTFREVLQQTRATCLDAYAHQDLPFEMLVEALRPERDLSYTPLFQVLFVLQSAPAPVIDLGEARLELLDTHSGIVRHDITLSIAETSDGLRADWQYNADLFDVATIARLAGHFQTLLEAVVADPDQRVAYLPVLTGAERDQLLVRWNDTRADYPSDITFHTLVERQAEQTPDVVALVFGDGHLTYRALDRRANQLAWHLISLGAGPEVRIGLCIERSLEMLLGMLGVLKAGSAYVPLDPTYPQARLSFMLEDAGVPILLTQAQLLPELDRNLPARPAHVVCIDADWPAVARQSDAPPASGATADSLAYIIYTSGSTGKPKGTLLSHRGMCNLAKAELDTLGVGVGSRVLQFASLSFDSSVWEIVMTLGNGATFCLAERDTLFSPDGLAQLLRTSAVTLAKMPPSVLATLPFVELPDLATLIVAGQSCPGSLVERWSPGRTFINAYGPTEITVCATLARCAGAYPQGPPIGRPLPNLQTYVLDRHLQPAPVGVPGELCLGAVGLARGYLNRPELTAEKFVPHPFSPPVIDGGDARGGLRLYRTGDLARWLPDGTLEFLGRIDHQVKVRGFRVELGEIEALLAQYPGVRDVVVDAREVDTALGGKRLVAYLVAQPESRSMLTVSDLRSYLQSRLPDYMLPSAFVILDALPLTPHGKVDRHALPAPDHARPDLADAFVAPRTTPEIALAKIWSEALGVQQVGMHDNFFELGGDSILTIQIVSRANQAGLRLSPKQIFQHQTIARLAEVVEVAQAGGADQRAVTGPVPLTPIQQRFFEQGLLDRQHWNQAVLLEARQPLNPMWLRQAVASLVIHHDALRLRFSQTAIGWEQFSGDALDTDLFVHIDLSALPAAQQTAALALVAGETQASLNLSDGPLVRAVWFECGSHARLLIAIHHLAVDGVSWRILLDDLQTAYQQLGRGEAVVLPPKTTSFKRWAEQLQAYAQTDVVRGESAYWLDVAYAYAPRLPIDFPDSAEANLEADAHTVSVSLDVDETRALLHDVPAVYHTQINDVLLTAWVQSFAEWSGERTTLIDLEGQGREDLFDGVDLSRTVGWFTAVFPVVLSLGVTDQPGEALKAVKEQLRRVPQHGIGYGVLRYLGEATLADQLRAAPQAEVSFNYLGQFDQTGAALSLFQLAGDDAGPARSPRAARRYRLAISGRVIDGRLQLDWIYSQRLHRHSTVERVAQRYLAALRALIAHCLSPDAGGYTPSDFAEFQWSQPDLDDIAHGIGQALGED